MKKRIAVRILSALMALLLLAALCALAGCRGNADGQEKKLSVVAAVFPVYDWVKNILGDRAESVELTLLLDSGVDLHNYQPTVDDIVKLSNCDLFIYVGGESDGWAADALKDPRNPDRKVINLLEVLGDAAKDEETVAGMEHGDDHEDDHEEADGHEDEAGGEEGHGAEIPAKHIGTVFTLYGKDFLTDTPDSPGFHLFLNDRLQFLHNIKGIYPGSKLLNQGLRKGMYQTKL